MSSKSLTAGAIALALAVAGCGSSGRTQAQIRQCWTNAAQTLAQQDTLRDTQPTPGVAPAALVQMRTQGILASAKGPTSDLTASRQAWIKATRAKCGKQP